MQHNTAKSTRQPLQKLRMYSKMFSAPGGGDAAFRWCCTWCWCGLGWGWWRWWWPFGRIFWACLKWCFQGYGVNKEGYQRNGFGCSRGPRLLSTFTLNHPCSCFLYLSVTIILISTAAEVTIRPFEQLIQLVSIYLVTFCDRSHIPKREQCRRVEFLDATWTANSSGGRIMILEYVQF